jgi:hypothetical protein
MTGCALRAGLLRPADDVPTIRKDCPAVRCQVRPQKHSAAAQEVVERLRLDMLRHPHRIPLETEHVMVMAATLKHLSAVTHRHGRPDC